MAGLNNRPLCWFHGVVAKRLEMALVPLIHLRSWREGGAEETTVLRNCVILADRPRIIYVVVVVVVSRVGSVEGEEMKGCGDGRPCRRIERS